MVVPKCILNLLRNFVDGDEIVTWLVNFLFFFSFSALCKILTAQDQPFEIDLASLSMTLQMWEVSVTSEGFHIPDKLASRSKVSIITFLPQNFRVCKFYNDM